MEKTDLSYKDLYKNTFFIECECIKSLDIQIKEGGS